MQCFRVGPFTCKKDNMESRLDRCLINMSWRIRYKEAFIQNLIPLKSDLKPLLLCFFSVKIRNMRRRPFRFEAAWLTHS